MNAKAQRRLQNENNKDDDKQKRPSTSMQVAANREFAILLFSSQLVCFLRVRIF